jgi:hypothetical protein
MVFTFLISFLFVPMRQIGETDKLTRESELRQIAEAERRQVRPTADAY